MSNVSLTATKVEDNVTVSVGLDSSSVLDKVRAMVDAANSLLTSIGTQTAITTASSGSTTGSALTGNSLVRQINDSILSAAGNGLSGYGSFSQMGIQTSRDGTLTFDEATFTKAYAADPTKVQAALTDGFGKSLKELATTANTTITATIQSGSNTIRTLNDQIDDWTVRLDARQEALQKQYANLEVALGKLKNQSTWLAGQVSALSASSSS